MNKEKKTFDRSNGFYFYGHYFETFEMIEEDLGAEAAVEYIKAICKYALFEEEPEIKGVLKYFWTQTKEKIDGHQESRARGFREDTELTEKIIEYKKNNPNSTQRDIADALKCSVGKVNKVLNNFNSTNFTINSSNSSSFSNTFTNSSSSSNTSVNVNVNKDIHDVTHSPSAQTKDRDGAERLKKEDLTEEEEKNILKDYESRMSYREIQKKYNLGFQVKEFIEEISAEAKKIEDQQKQDKAFQRKLADLDELMTALANKGIYTTKEEVIAKCKEIYNSNKPNKFKWSCKDLVEKVVNNKYSDSKLDDTFDSVIKEFDYLQNQCA